MLRMKMMGKWMLTRPSSSFCPFGRWILTFNPPHLCSSLHLCFHSESRNVTTLDEALSCFNRMLHMHPPPSVVDFNYLLNFIADMKRYSTLISLSRQMDSFGIPPNPDTLDILTDSFCLLNRIDFGFSVLAKTLKLFRIPNTATFNTLIWGLCVKGEIVEAIRFFDKMVRRYYLMFETDEVTCETLVNELSKAGSKRALITMGGRRMSIEQGNRNRQVNLLFTDSNSTIFRSILFDQQLFEALLPLRETIFREDMSPIIGITISGTSMIHTPCNHCVMKHVAMLAHETVYNKRMPDEVTFSIAVNEFCKQGEIAKAHDVFIEMIEIGMKPEVVTYNMLMDGYVVRSEMNEALKVYHTMLHNGCTPDVCTYCILISRYCKIQRIDKALHLFEKIREEELIPRCDTETHLQIAKTLVHALCRAGELQAAWDLLCYFPDKKLTWLPDVQTCNIMVQELCNRCLFDEVDDLFMEMRENLCSPDVCSYNIVMQALLQNNEIFRALQLLEEMFGKGFFMASSTVILLLKTFSHDALDQSEKQEILHKLSNLKKAFQVGMHFKALYEK